MVLLVPFQSKEGRPIGNAMSVQPGPRGCIIVFVPPLPMSQLYQGSWDSFSLLFRSRELFWFWFPCCCIFYAIPFL